MAVLRFEKTGKGKKMADRKLFGWAVAAVIVAALFATPSWAAGRAAREGARPAAAPAVVYVPVTLDATELETGTIDWVALLKRISFAGCSGGSCATGTNTALNCPTSGGPTCQSGTTCSCTCASAPNGSWAAVNRCEAD